MPNKLHMGIHTLSNFVASVVYMFTTVSAHDKFQSPGPLYVMLIYKWTMISQLTVSLQHTVLGVSYLHPLVVDIFGFGGRTLPLDPGGLLLAEGDVSLCSCLLEPSLAVWTLDIVWVGGRGLGRRERSTCTGLEWTQNHIPRASTTLRMLGY